MFIVVQRTRICDADIRKKPILSDLSRFCWCCYACMGNLDIYGSRFNCNNLFFFSISVSKLFFLLDYFSLCLVTTTVIDLVSRRQ